MNTQAEFIGTLLHSATIAHFMHLQVDGPGSYAAHKALETYYEEIVGLVDTLAEEIQGATDTIIGPYSNMFSNTSQSPLEYMTSLRDYVTTARKDMPQLSEVQNAIDEIKTLINSTVYKLTRLK